MGNKVKLLMIDHYDSFTYNLLALIELQGIKVDLIKNNEYRAITGYDALVFSPGPSNPVNAGISLRYFDEWAGKLPIFGVCLGMQIMAYKLAEHGLAGYKVHAAVSIQHGKTDELKVQLDSQLFAGIPKQGAKVVRYHSLAIAAPEEQISSRAQSDNEVMSLEIPQWKLYGVQFHPESILSEYGAEIIQNFISLL